MIWQGNLVIWSGKSLEEVWNFVALVYMNPYTWIWSAHSGKKSLQNKTKNIQFAGRSQRDCALHSNVWTKLCRHVMKFLHRVRTVLKSAWKSSSFKGPFTRFKCLENQYFKKKRGGGGSTWKLRLLCSNRTSWEFLCFSHPSDSDTQVWLKHFDFSWPALTETLWPFPTCPDWNFVTFPYLPWLSPSCSSYLHCSPLVFGPCKSRFLISCFQNFILCLKITQKLPVESPWKVLEFHLPKSVRTLLQLFHFWSGKIFAGLLELSDVQSCQPLSIGCNLSCLSWPYYTHNESIMPQNVNKMAIFMHVCMCLRGEESPSATSILLRLCLCQWAFAFHSGRPIIALGLFSLRLITSLPAEMALM